MNEIVHDSHPESEALAAFVDGNLQGADLVRMSDHLRGCAECRMIAGEAARFEREEGSPQRRGRSMWWWTAVAAAAAMVAIGIVVVPQLRDPIDQLQPAAYRPYLGRFTAFRYAPFRVTRSAEAQRADYRQLAAAARLQSRLAEARTPRNLHRFALAESALGHSSEAATLLREAAASRPDDAAIYNDLAAAELSAGDSAEAADAARHALELNPAMTEAAFNLAVALGMQHERNAAMEAWAHYLRLDSSTQWAEEARSQLQQLQASSR